jgi:hypothetical protein
MILLSITFELAGPCRQNALARLNKWLGLARHIWANNFECLAKPENMRRHILWPRFRWEWIESGGQNIIDDKWYECLVFDHNFISKVSIEIDFDNKISAGLKGRTGQCVQKRCA